MKQVQIPWGEGTLTELKMFAAQVLGMMTSPNIGEESLRAKIRVAFQGDTLTILVDDTVQKPPGEERTPPPEPETEQPEPFAELSPAGAFSRAPGAPAPPIGGKPMVGAIGKIDPTVLVTIPEVEGPGGKRDVFVSVNGVAMLVPRGSPVPIPYRYYMALMCAVKQVHHQDEDTHEIITSEVPAYPMSVNIMPAKSEIDAYLAAEQKAA